jgi:two-component system sensor histidine kinase KdpD
MCVGAAKQIEGVTGNEVCLLLKDDAGELSSAFGAGGVAPVGSEDLDAATWAANHLEPAGAGTRNLPSGKTCYLPLIAGRGCIGVVSLRAREPGGAPARPSSLIVAMVNQCAMSIERGLLIDETQATRLEVETERIRNAVLSSVSHDLRTPLAIIGSAASTLMEHGDRLESKARTEMAKIVNDEARRLSELLKSLLDITRLQSGGLRVNRDWESLEEVIGSVLRRIEEQAGTGQVLANVPSTLPLVRIDAILIEQVLANLIDNALKYARSEGPIEINIAIRSELDVVVSVIDHGRGIPSGELTRIFEKFYRNGETSGTGLGLGLTIARGIVEAHGGRIWAVQTAGTASVRC